MEKKRLVASSVAAAIAAAAPFAESAMAPNCERPGVICGPSAPRPDDNHVEHVFAAVGTASNAVIGTGTGTGTAAGGPPGPSADQAAAMDAIMDPLLYPDFVGVQPRIVTTGTQEGPSLW